MLKRFTFAVMTAVFGLTVAASTTLAQNTPGQGLEISPPLIEVNIDPGKTISFDIRLRNVTQGTLIATPHIDDFVAQGEEGQPKLLLDEADKPAEASPFSIKSWVQSLGQLRLVSQEAKTTKVTLNVPADASPGGHYGVIRFSAAPPELEGTGVALSASIGTLVLVKVSGDIKDSAKFEEFFTTQSGKRKALFETGPITFVERVKNDGNVHFKPTGTVRITDMFGKETGVVTINEKAGNVLPDSIRKFEQTLNKKWLFGRYMAEANLQYAGKNISDTISFWVIPYKLIAIALGGLILIIWVIRKLLKHYVQRAVSKASTSSKTTKKTKK